MVPTAGGEPPAREVVNSKAVNSKVGDNREHNSKDGNSHSSLNNKDGVNKEGKVSTKEDKDLIKEVLIRALVDKVH